MLATSSTWLPSHMVGLCLVLLVCSRAYKVRETGREQVAEKVGAILPSWRAVNSATPIFGESHRMPALLVLRSGVVLAFAERRPEDEDLVDTDLIMKRSQDGGRTWSISNTLCDFGDEVCGSPSPVEDRAGGVHVLMSRHPAEASNGPGHTLRSVWITSSFDQGVTWSSPREISTSVKPPHWKWYATGPGHGLRLQQQRDPRLNGRLLVACEHTVLMQNGKHHYFSHVIFSDDHGKTWRVGGTVPAMPSHNSNEASLAELSDGRLVLSARNLNGNDGHSNNRLLSMSPDGGISWTMVYPQAGLNAVDCAGSLAQIPRRLAPFPGSFLQRGTFVDGGTAEVLMFTHSIGVARATRGDGWMRTGLRLSISIDGGFSWPQDKSTVLFEKDATGHSDAQVLADGSLMIVYERGDDGISFMALRRNT
eukprot:TRINITY_DN24066_c0_g2_i1.p1 TRINITY_DN24066_c0_g2~~TRINITY_DN24066_c0_g2_i1.p1  ORF type:complete len:422 (+),score=26.74 TRINITY_DN24066_c0_g2_i1:50-1315(+)